VEPLDVGARVQDRERADALRHRRAQLEPDRPAEVVDHEVELVDPEGVDGRHRPGALTRPRVVETRRAFRQPEPRKVERDPAQPVRRKPRQQLAVQERRSRNAVEAERRFAVALLADEAPNTGREEVPAVRPVRRDDRCRGRRLTPGPHGARPPARRTVAVIEAVHGDDADAGLGRPHHLIGVIVMARSRRVAKAGRGPLIRSG
jgi:hypothetical protein